MPARASMSHTAAAARRARPERAAGSSRDAAARLRPRTVRLAHVVTDPARLPKDGRPQVALMGRSNVGKSSLLNRILGRSGLARVSKAPGRTRELHFYEVDERLYIVDLPGFGYAKVSRDERRGWARLVEGYLDAGGPLELAIHLVDSRHEPTPLDALMQETLAARRLPTLVALTKADKLRASAAARAVDRARRSLRLDDAVPVILTSAKTGLGLGTLSRQIARALDARRSEG